MLSEQKSYVRIAELSYYVISNDKRDSFYILVDGFEGYYKLEGNVKYFPKRFLDKKGNPATRGSFDFVEHGDMRIDMTEIAQHPFKVIDHGKVKVDIDDVLRFDWDRGFLREILAHTRDTLFIKRWYNGDE